MVKEGFFKLLNYHPPTDEERRGTTSSVHGAVLVLAARLLAWVRPWDAKAAPRCAYSHWVACTKAMVITIAAAMQSYKTQKSGN